ncbi:MAG: prevent-host-death protein [Desulfuromonas sp. SDB]|nr:MAG: prevent-host-death protein [Desulfuromonas sp. SDB]
MINLTATKARSKLFEIIKDAVNKHKIFHIRHKQGDVVLLSEEEYESLQETLNLLSIPGFRESISRSVRNIEEGEVYPFEEVFNKDQ